MKKTTTKKVQCCSQTNRGDWCQETYETASRDAGRRAKELRAAGYRVTVSSMGAQVTPLGTIGLTMVDVRPGVHQDTFGLPVVNHVNWPDR